MMCTIADNYQPLYEDEGRDVTDKGLEKKKLTLTLDEERHQAHKSGVATLQAEQK